MTLGWQGRKRNGEEMGRIYFWKVPSKTFHHYSNMLFSSLSYFLSPITNFPLGYRKCSVMLTCLAVWKLLILSHIRKKTLHPNVWDSRESQNGRTQTTNKKIEISYKYPKKTLIAEIAILPEGFYLCGSFGNIIYITPHIYPPDWAGNRWNKRKEQWKWSITF